MRPLSRGRGFTLIELLVVLALAGLLMGLVPPMLSAAMPGMQLKNTAKQLVSALRETRSEAVHLGRPMDYHLDLENNLGLLRSDRGDRRLQLPDRLAYRFTTAESLMQAEREGAFRFYPDGSASGGRIEVLYQERGYRIDIDWLTAQIRTREFRDD